MSEYDTDNENIAQTIERVALRSQSPITSTEGGEDVLIVPDGYRVENCEQFAMAPSRIRRTLKVLTPEALIAYFAVFAEDHSRIYANPHKVTVQAILDDHVNANGPRWGSHRVSYEAPYSREWKAWIGQDRTRMNQLDFARFLEDRQADITAPGGAELLDIATQLEIKRDVSYRSATRLETGELNFAYSEENAGNGSVAIPAAFVLGIPVFHLGTAYQITARLRYHLSGGRLELWYELVEPDKYVEDAFSEVLRTIADATDRIVYLAEAVG